VQYSHEPNGVTIHTKDQKIGRSRHFQAAQAPRQKRSLERHLLQIGNSIEDARRDALAPFGLWAAVLATSRSKSRLARADQMITIYIWL
jgi:hypothetical protein